MAWTTATVLALEPSPSSSQIRVVVAFGRNDLQDDSGQTHVHDFFCDQNTLKNGLNTQVSQYLSELNTRDAVLVMLQRGPLDLKAVLPPLPSLDVPLTPLQTFLILAARYRRVYDLLVAPGLDSNSVPELLAMKEAVLKAYDPTFVGLL